MKARPVVLRATADRDIATAIGHYQTEGPATLTMNFISGIESAFRHIAQFPGSGSPKYGLALNLPGLRSWPVEGFPYLVFYTETTTHLDVWRVLHAERDIPASILDGG